MRSRRRLVLPVAAERGEANTRNPAKPKAERKAANALAVKALWIDADVGPKEGEYATLQDAIKALILFREKHKLPMYSALVASGGGLHAYWISKTAMTVKEWAPYAEGLRALMLAEKLVKDASITTDVARILRVPGTFNHKTNPPKPVQLLELPLAMYDFADKLSFLPTLAPVVSTIKASVDEYSPFHPDADMAAFKRPPIMAPIAGENLGAVEQTEAPLLDPRPIFKNCGFCNRDALLTGGQDNDQPQWNLAILGTTFMAKGSEIAHKISSGHSTYSEADTQAMYDRKAREQSALGIGYPSCAAIANAGGKACKNVPTLR